MDVLVIYQFCTYGGVERVLLNRAKAFKQKGMDVYFHVGYLQDFGALDSFKKYIQENDLERFLRPFLISPDFSFEKSHYDLVSVIDTPQVLDKKIPCRNLFIECHTPYVENRQYLKNIPRSVKGILVPSKTFCSTIRSEFPRVPEIFVLPNSVPDEFYDSTACPPIFERRPLTYLARIDELKNYSEALQLFASVQNRDDIMQIIIGQGATSKERLSVLKNTHLLEKTLLRDRIAFDQVPALVNLIRQHKGIFISPSKGESFGLSAAEFICGGVPVLLSDIPEHRELVNRDERFLYPLGKISIARRKLTQILDNWETLSHVISGYSTKFRGDKFVREWSRLVQLQGLSL
jgi:glycosyltransferase involved in cell wall biosynthesis